MVTTAKRWTMVEAAMARPDAMVPGGGPSPRDRYLRDTIMRSLLLAAAALAILAGSANAQSSNSNRNASTTSGSPSSTVSPQERA